MILKEETTDREKEAEGEKPRAQIFFIAYTKDGVKDKSKRPLTFSFKRRAWFRICGGCIWACWGRAEW
jgi:hypothetical protein